MDNCLGLSFVWRRGFSKHRKSRCFAEFVCLVRLDIPGLPPLAALRQKHSELMPTHQTAEQLLEETTRLTRGLDHWRNWNIEEYRRRAGCDAAIPYTEYVSPGGMLFILVPDGLQELEKLYDTLPANDTGAYWLAKVDPKAVRLPNARAALKQLRQWYSYTGSDIRFFQTKFGPDEAQKYTSYLERFHRDVGFDFMSETGCSALGLLRHS